MKFKKSFFIALMIVLCYGSIKKFVLDKPLTLKEQIYNPIVYIENETSKGVGSGVIVHQSPKKDGKHIYIGVTVYHILIVEEENINVTIDSSTGMVIQTSQMEKKYSARFFIDGKYTEKMEVKIIEEHPDLDMAMFGFESELSIKPAAYATPHMYKKLEFMQEVYVVGNALGEIPFVSKGNFVTKISHEGNTVLVTSANIINGCSGGGLFAKIDGRFRLIGVIQRYRMNGFSEMNDPVYYMSGHGSLENLEVFNE